MQAPVNVERAKACSSKGHFDRLPYKHFYLFLTYYKVKFSFKSDYKLPLKLKCAANIKKITLP